MKCPHCKQETQKDGRFCQVCGSSLGTAREFVDTGAAELQALREEVRHLSGRLHNIENSLKISPRTAPSTLGKHTPASKAIPETTQPDRLQPSLSPKKPGTAADRAKEWEQILGGNWLARIGILLLVIGTGFFLKYAFDNDWLNETSRVVLGVLIGFALLWGGYHWKNTYPAFAQALDGGGIALIYLSIFAAFAVFEMIPFYPALIVLVVISAGSVAIAVLYNSISLAILGIIGAFIAPIILGVSAPETESVGETGQGFNLLLYVIVIDLGIIALSTLRNWRWFNLIGLLGSLATFGAWYNHYHNSAGLLTAEGSLTLLFLIFVGATVYHHTLKRRPPREFDYVLIVINAAAYLGISYGLLWDDLRGWCGGFSFLLSLFYGGLTYLAYKRKAENLNPSLLTLGIALVLLTLAIPVQWNDSAWTTVLWATEAVILVWLSFKLRLPLLRIFSYSVYAVTIVRLIFFDTSVSATDFHLAFNERFLAFTVSIASIYTAAWLIEQKKEVLLPKEKDSRSVYQVFLIAASVLSIWLLSFELWDFFDTRNTLDIQSLSLSALWAVYASILLVLSDRKHSPLLRHMALALFILTIAKIVFYDLFSFFDTKISAEEFSFIINERFLAFIIDISALYFASWFTWRDRSNLLPWEKSLPPVHTVFLIAANLLSIWLLSFELWDYFDTRGTENGQILSLTVLWAVYAVILLIAGIVRRSPLVRLMALALLTVAISKVFIYDVSTLDRVYRIIAFTGLGILLIVSGYLYQRYSRIIRGFILNG